MIPGNETAWKRGIRDLQPQEQRESSYLIPSHKYVANSLLEMYDLISMKKHPVRPEMVKQHRKTLEKVGVV